jgi:periplasmic protein TonB
MSYLEHADDPRRRAAALTGTVAIHVVLGVVVLTGLTIAGYKPVTEYNPIIEFPTAPPPQPPEPVPQPQPPEQTFVAPTPPIPIPLPPQPGPRVDEFDQNQLVIPDVSTRPDPGPTARPEPPRPTPSFAPKIARPSNNQARWITNDDYPSRALRDGSEGLAGYRLIVGSGGRVSSCEITASTGNRLLDETTCRLISSRARFDPATDENGARVVGSYSGTVRWQIPD